jgi:hypothetical protein
MPLLLNKSKRLITLNAPHTPQKNSKNDEIIGSKAGEAYDLMPAGQPVEVPESVATSRYAKALIDTGDIEVVKGESSSDDDDDQFKGIKKADLQTLAESMGLEFDDRTTVAELKALIESAQ